jgi:hypothetical protein
MLKHHIPTKIITKHPQITIYSTKHSTNLYCSGRAGIEGKLDKPLTPETSCATTTLFPGGGTLPGCDLSDEALPELSPHPDITNINAKIPESTTIFFFIFYPFISAPYYTIITALYITVQHGNILINAPKTSLFTHLALTHLMNKSYHQHNAFHNGKNIDIYYKIFNINSKIPPNNVNLFSKMY